MPDSDIQCVCVNLELLVISTQVSEPVSENIATVLLERCACMKGIAPYIPISESARYSKVSRLNRRYGSVKAPSPPLSKIGE